MISRFCEFPLYVANKHLMLSHHFLTRNGFYDTRQLKIQSSYKNNSLSDYQYHLIGVGDQMVVFLGEIRVSSNKIMSNSKFENIFTFLVSKAIAVPTVYTLSHLQVYQFGHSSHHILLRSHQHPLF